MSTVRRITEADIDWLAGVLAQRRAELVPHAPTFWHPSPHADAFHRRFMTKLITASDARGYRTDDAALVAAPSAEGWTVDDATVPAQRWIDDPAGAALWNAFATDCAGAQVRMVCPVYDEQRCAFARLAGLELAETWWLLELPDDGGGEAGVRVELPGAQAFTTAAPPVYAPPGPMLFLPRVTDPRAVAAAVAQAPRYGCAGIIVSERPADGRMVVDHLRAAGLHRHCDYYRGRVTAMG